MNTYKEWKAMMDKEDKRTKQRVEAKEVVEDIIEYIKWEKYRYPRDENERGHNRWIDRAVDMIESEFLF